MLEVLIFVSGVADVFTEGTNPIRFALLIAYGCLVALATGRLPLSWEKVLKRTAILSLVALYALSLGTQVWLYATNDIPQQALAVAVADSEITNTRHTHIHIGKSGLANLVSPIQDFLVTQADTGLALQTFVPSWLPIMTAALLVVAGVSLILSSAVLIQTLQTRSRTALFVLVTLAGYIALAKSVDGGLLSDGAVMACVAISSLMLASTGSFSKIMAGGIVGFAAVFTTLHLFGFYWGEGYALNVLMKSIALAIVLIALHAAHTRGFRNAIGVVLIAAVTVGLYTYANVSEKYTYLGKVVMEGKTYIRYQDGKYGSGDHYAGQTTRSVIEAEKLPYWYQPVTHYKEACAATDEEYVALFTLITKDAPEHFSVDMGEESIELVKQGDRYSVTMLLHPCIPSPLQSVPKLLKEVGINTALIYGYESRVVPKKPDMGISEVRN